MPMQSALEQILLQRKLVTPEQLQQALAQRKQSNSTLAEELSRSGMLSEAALIAVLSEHTRLPRIELKKLSIPAALIESIPPRFVTHYNCVPFREVDGALQLAISDPLDINIIDEIKLLLKRPVGIFLATPSEIREVIKQHYGIGAKTMAQMVDSSLHLQVLSQSGAAEFPGGDAADSDEHSVIKFLDQVIQHAVNDRATDIHIEPFGDRLRVRYRIDGLLYDVPVPASIHHFHAAIMIRIKIMAALDIAEKRLPQDGRIQVKIDTDEYDLRVSLLPTSFGESAVIRILSRKQICISLEFLGIAGRDLQTINHMLQRPHGIILVTGPTGSGKTTTLYACLQKINSNDRKIITIEDPIEYKLYGISQVQVQPKIELTFANGLRSMLRHDPDIMMVGEIRDLETAELAIRTALTGHLVFSTIHTNDAAGAVTRLQDMGIEPYLVSSSLNCLIAQRLVRKICPHCREPYVPPPEILRQLAQDAPLRGSERFFKGSGCEQCKFTGYQGRTGIFEILEVKDSIREMMLNRVPSNLIKEKAMQSGMRTLRQFGWEKVIQGETTPEEVVRVTQDDME